MAEALRAAPPNWREQAMKSLTAKGSTLTWERAKQHLSQQPDEEGREWDVFACYASEDREAVAGPLSAMLSDLGLRVWYDQMELRVGDSIRGKIRTGLKRCRFGVVILSESFFGKRYPESELSGLDQREQDGGKIILPVWHDIDEEFVRLHDPRLADRVALKWQDGIVSVTTELLKVIAPDILRDVIERDQALTEYIDEARVPRIATGADLTTLLGTYGFFFFNDKLRDEDMNLVGEFQQALEDWSDIWHEVRPPERAEAASHLTDLLERLHEQGWTVHGSNDRRKPMVGGKAVDWPVAVIAVVRGHPSGVMNLGNGRIVIMRDDDESTKNA